MVQPIGYIGLLDTDTSTRPTRMFLQGKHSPERYVLDRLPPWIEVEARYCSGVNWCMLSSEARETLYQQLIAGHYRVCQITGGKHYLLVSEVFCP